MPHRFATRHPVVVLFAGIAVVLAFVPGLGRLRVHTDGAALVPADDPVVVFDRELRTRFGLNDQAVVLVDTSTPGGVYRRDVLRLVQRLTEEIQALEGIGPLNVASLATELSDRYKPGTLSFHDLLTPFPETEAACARVRDDVEANGLYVGNLVSIDASAAAILFGTPLGIDRVDLSRQVWSILESIDTELVSGPVTLRTIGAPFAEALLGHHILEDLGLPDAVLGHTPASASGGAAHGLFAARRWIGENVGLLPIAIALMALVFWIGFGRATAMVLPLVQVAACLVFTFGLMGYLGVPIHLTTAVLPIILTSIGVADEVHLLGRFLQIGRGDPLASRHALVERTMREMTRPVVRTSVTTGIGFLSFALAPIMPVRMFGIFATTGILFCMTWSLTVTPALLVLLPRRLLLSRGAPTPQPPVTTGAAPANAPPPRWATLGLRHPRVVVGLALLLALLAGDGIRRLVVQDSWIDGFDPHSTFHRATQVFNAGFFGPHILQILIDTGHQVWEGRITAGDVRDNVYRLPLSLERSPQELRGAMLRVRVADSTATRVWDRLGRADPVWRARVDSVVVHGDSVAFHAPLSAGTAEFLLRLAGDEELRLQVEARRFDTFEALQATADLATFIRGRDAYAVGGVLGPADYLATTNFILHRREAGSRRIPRSGADIESLWHHFARVRGAHYVHRALSDDHSQAILTVYLKNANYQDTSRLMQDIRAWEAEHLAPQGIHLQFAGDVAVSQALIGAIVETQVRSLLFSLVGVLLVSMLLQRSWRLGGLTLLPCAFAILLNFGWMGWTVMPLGVATSMFAGMILGIGVDFAIHLLDRHRRSCDAGMDRARAIADAVTVAGRPILIDACAIALGFGVLMVSRVPANARLGTLAVLCVVSCVAATLALLPALMQDPRRRD